MDKTKIEVKNILYELVKHEWIAIDNKHTVDIVIDNFADRIQAIYTPIGFKPKETTFVPKGPNDDKI